MYILKNIMDRYRHEMKSLYIVFVDFKQAFDTIWHCGLYINCIPVVSQANYIISLSLMYGNTTVDVQDGDGLIPGRNEAGR